MYHEQYKDSETGLYYNRSRYYAPITGGGISQDPISIAATHQKYYGSNALHPYLPNAHPDNPVNRDLFKIDREAYWKQRAEVEINARKRKEFANNKIDIYVVRKS